MRVRFAQRFVVAPFAVVVLCIMCVSLNGADGTRNPARDWDWAPPYRSVDDCGPQSLFALLRLERKNVSVWDVRNLVKIEVGRGCSIDALRQAAHKLGCSTEVRFVNPRRLNEVSCPFIIHGVTASDQHGLFAVVVGYDPRTKRFAMIDPTFEVCSWYAEEGVLSQFSGYVLIPTRLLDNGRDAWAAVTLFGVGIVLLVWTRGSRTKNVEGSAF